MELTRTTKRHVYWFNYTVNLFMCWSDTASIYCLYLLGSLSPAVRLHSLAYSSFEVTGKMLLTFFLWFLLLSWGGQNKKEVKSYDWSLGLLCLFYQIGCVFQKKSILCSQCIHTVFWLFACVSQNQCTVKRESQRVVTLLLKSHTA